MCGLAVALGRDRADDVYKMLRAMGHRGTQEPQVARAGAFTMGHVRLPINGLTSEFDQPYWDHGLCLCFVGEIVNFKEIAPSAKSDLPVLAKRWHAKGPGCVKEFDGFWSIAGVLPGGPLYIVTDFLGKKPVYYREDVGAFASEIRALAALAPVSPDPLYFSSVRKWGYHVGRHTWAREIIKLPPGSLTTYDPLGGIAIQERFDVVEPDWTLDLKAEIVRAVERRVCASDVPVALLCSGGLDSSIVYKLARGLRSDLTVYHAPNEGDSIEELFDDRNVASVRMIGHSATWDERAVLRWNEGPVDLGSVWPQLALGQLVDERVALSGDGADELFGGYRRSTEYDSQHSDVYEEIPHYHAPRLDKLMMAGTVELRCPFMSRSVLAGALALPWEQRQNKLWLRRAFEDLLPSGIAWGDKVPLKTDVIRADPIARRRDLCDTFLDMIAKGDVM